MWVIWLILCLLFLITDFLHHDHFFIFFTAGSLFSCFSSLIFHNIIIQLSIFLIIAFLVKLIFSKQKFFHKFTAKKNFSLTTDALIGKKGKVIKSIGADTLQSGLVKLDGEIWVAVSSTQDSISKGSFVKVDSIQGVRLNVSLISK